jgi:hypothetical protein
MPDRGIVQHIAFFLGMGLRRECPQDVVTMPIVGGGQNR